MTFPFVVFCHYSEQFFVSQEEQFSDGLSGQKHYLSWHYRSTHESLIAFSNHEFYDNRMFTFPSANDREKHVVRVQVDGTYSKSVNAKEAEAIVAEIIRRYRDPALQKLSIGVVTFNVKQQDLINNFDTIHISGTEKPLQTHGSGMTSSQ